MDSNPCAQEPVQDFRVIFSLVHWQVREYMSSRSNMPDQRWIAQNGYSRRPQTRTCLNLTKGEAYTLRSSVVFLHFRCHPTEQHQASIGIENLLPFPHDDSVHTITVPMVSSRKDDKAIIPTRKRKKPGLPSQPRTKRPQPKTKRPQVKTRSPNQEPEAPAKN